MLSCHSVCAGDPLCQSRSLAAVTAAPPGPPRDPALLRETEQMSLQGGEMHPDEVTQINVGAFLHLLNEFYALQSLQEIKARRRWLKGNRTSRIVKARVRNRKKKQSTVSVWSGDETKASEFLSSFMPGHFHMSPPLSHPSITFHCGQDSCLELKHIHSSAVHQIAPNPVILQSSCRRGWRGGSGGVSEKQSCVCQSAYPNWRARQEKKAKCHHMSEIRRILSWEMKNSDIRSKVWPKSINSCFTAEAKLWGLCVVKSNVALTMRAANCSGLLEAV